MCCPNPGTLHTVYNYWQLGSLGALLKRSSSHNRPVAHVHYHWLFASTQTVSTAYRWNTATLPHCHFCHHTVVVVDELMVVV